MGLLVLGPFVFLWWCLLRYLDHPGDHLFTVRIHHRGRFYSNGGVNRQYRGAEGVVYVDEVDPDKILVTGFNYWAYDLGYTHGPIMYWYRIPGSEPGTGYLPVVTDADAMDMLQFIPSRDRILDVYFVCLAGRRHFQDWELDHFDDEVEHLLYLGHFIEDLPLTALEEEQLGPVGEDADQGGSDVKDHVIGQDGGNGGPSNAPTDGPRSGASRPTHVTRNALRRQVFRRRPTVGINIREPSALVQGSQASVQVSGLTTNSAKEKGKQKLDEVGKTKGKKPKKAVARRYETRGGGECSYAAPEDDGWSSETTNSDDPNYDGFVDSDYELFDEEDEVLFEKNVDGDPSKVAEWEEMGFEGNISDAEADDSDGFPSIHGSDSDGEDLGPFKVKGKKEFNPRTDMKDPRFQIGMVFPSSVIFKKVVRKHAVLTRKELCFEKNTRHKVKVVCKTSPGCPFWIYASSPSEHTPSLMIKVYKPNNQCSSIEGKVYHCHAPFIAEEYMDQFMVDGKWSREGIQNAVNRDFGMDIGYQICYRAKMRAARMAQGSYEDQYNILESYANELKKRNPGTSVWIQTEIEGEVTRCKRIYICFEALKQGWRAGCRPILGLDGCHLKGAHKGQLLSAVGIDGNNGIYPVAYAIVETENKDSWTWFLTFMRADLQIYSSVDYAFISDKQKGLEQAIKDLFPHSEHRHCVRHLHNNFKGDGHSGLALKQLFWGVARSNTMTQYNRAMENLQNASYNAWKWCADRPASHWSRSHFSDKLKCDILLNNHSESFNKSLLEARKKPIIPCLEDMRIALMVRLNNKRNSAAKWRCNVGPRIEKVLKKNATWSHDYRALQSSEHRFELQGRGVACESGVISQHSVQLDMKSCTCRRWDLSGLPCAHVIAALYSKGWSPDDFVSEWYTKKKYLEAYEVVINPIAGVAEWEKKDRPIAPPLYRRQPGRPKSKRTKEPGEEPPPAGVERLPKSYYTQITCGTCHQKGHNKRTCQRRNQGGNAAGETQVSQVHVQPENDAHNVQPTAENTEDVHIPDGEPLPTQESTFDNADHFQSQASSAIPPSVNENQNVNLNVNVNLNIDSGGIDGNTMFSQTTNNVVHPSSETEQMHQGSPARPATSGKRVKRTAGRKFIARKSPRLAAAFASASIQAPKPKLQRALWIP